MPEGVTTRSPAAARARSESTTSSPISFFIAPAMNSRMEMVPPCAKNGRTRRSGSTPRTLDVSTEPSPAAVMKP